LKRKSVWASLAGVIVLVACGANETTPPDSTPPGRVRDLTIKNVRTNVITLRWTTPGDNGSQGTAKSYQVRWSPNIMTDSNFESAHMIPDPPIPATPGTVELFSVPNMDITQVIHFALRTYDEAGYISEISNDCLYTPGSLPVQFITELPAVRDNTIYGEADSLSNGSGQYLFAGVTAAPDSLIRRALLAFAIEDSIPAGAQIDSVRLTLHVSGTPAGPRAIELRALSADWGEGASNAAGGEESGAQAQTNDATWGFRFFNTDVWTLAGGDFVSLASATTTVDGFGAPGFFSWSATRMRDDVQNWLDAPGGNYGWIVLGDENHARTLKRFDSREHTTKAYRPRLKVYYTVVPPTP
jgi:hypothetical protein